MSTQNQAEILYPDEPLDLSRFVPYFVSGISNRWTSLSSRLYKTLFGIGIVEWRILGYLGSPNSEGKASASDIALDLGLDEALVSRGKQNLIELGYVEYAAAGRRFRPLCLTQAGLSLFEEIREHALARQAVLLGGLTDGEREEFLRLLRRVYAQLPELIAMDKEILAQRSPSDGHHLSRSASAAVGTDDKGE
jgi:DNA-binding MarR family transcriptional regulator